MFPPHVDNFIHPGRCHFLHKIDVQHFRSFSILPVMADSQGSNADGLLDFASGNKAIGDEATVDGASPGAASSDVGMAGRTLWQDREAQLYYDTLAEAAIADFHYMEQPPVDRSPARTLPARSLPARSLPARSLPSR
jgi:hypothetical protein